MLVARPMNENTGRVSPHKTKSLHNLRSLPPAPIRPSPVRPLQAAPDESSLAPDEHQEISTHNHSPVRGDSTMPRSAPAMTSSNPFRRTLSTPGDTTPSHPPGTVHPPLPNFAPALVAAALASSPAVADEDASPIRDATGSGLGRSLSTRTMPESPSNPFLRRTSHSPAPPPVRSQSPPLLPRRPPLPPRDSNHTMLPPPRHPQQPAKPPKPSSSSKPKMALMPAGGAPSELIKQSLRAAKGAQRANETSLEKQRTWEVIKSSTQGSSSNSGAGGVAQALAQLTASNLRTLAPNTPGGPTGPSTSASSSLDRVAAARPDPLPPLPPKPASHQGHSRSAIVSHHAQAESPMPGRPTRSKSMHHSPSQTPPLDSPIQPPPRRRPESIQFTGSGRPKQRAGSPSPTSTSVSVSRRASLARSHTLYDEVRRRAGELEPRLDAVRAKAEGKITSRGYVTKRGMGEQGESLVDLDDEGGASADGDMDWREWEQEDEARRFRQSPTRGLDVDRDVTTHDHGSSGWRTLPG